MTDYDGVMTGSATEELRRLLDERGVEYTGTHPAFTAWWGNHDLYWSAMEVYDGELDLGTNMSSVSPEQAIAATLGSGTCRNSAPTYLDFLCSECGFVHYHSDENDSGDGNEWRFCPNCGKRVVA